MKLLKKGMIFVLATLIVTLAGCAGGDTRWVFRSGEDEISAGLYIISQINAYSGAARAITAENENNADFVPPGQNEILKMTAEGKPVPEWIAEKAKQSSLEYIAVERKFDSLGLNLDEDDNAYIENAVSSMMTQNSDFYQKNGVSEDSLRKYYTVMLKKSILFDNLYGEGGEFAVPEAEIKDYFKANYKFAEILPVEIPYAVPEGETKTLEELKAESVAATEDYLKRAQSGEAMEDLVFEQVSKTASEEEKADLKKPEKDEISMVVSEKNRADYGDEFVDAIMGSKTGDTGRFEAMNYNFVYKIRDILEDASIFDSYRETLLGEMKAEDYEAKIAEWGSAIEFEENSAAIALYQPGKIKFDEPQE